MTEFIPHDPEEPTADEERAGMRLPNPLLVHRHPPTTEAAKHGPRIQQLPDSELYRRAGSRPIPAEVTEQRAYGRTTIEMDAPWMLPVRVEHRLHQLGDDRVSGDQPYTQHHSLDWLASSRLTNWAFNDRRRSAGLAILALVTAGIVAVILLAVVTLVHPIANGEVPVGPAPVATTPAGVWCAGCAPAPRP